MSDEIISQFPYRPGRFKIMAGFALVACGACMFGYFAVNPGNAPVGGLRPQQFQVFAGVIAALSPLGLLGLATALWWSLRRNIRVAFTASSIIVPKPNRLGVPCQEIEMPFSEIDSISVWPFVGGTLMLRIGCKSGGRVVCIFSGMFANRKDFETVRTMLDAAVS
jgi:hypothetical protein